MEKFNNGASLASIRGVLNDNADEFNEYRISNDAAITNPDTIVETAEKQFVSAEEKETWNNGTGSPGTGVTDGNKGDITVANSGAQWTVPKLVDKEEVGVAQELIDALKGGNTEDTISSLKTYIETLNTNTSTNSNAITGLMTLLNSDNSALDTLQEIVDYIEQNRQSIDDVLVNKVNVSTYNAFLTANTAAINAKVSLTDVLNALTQTAAGKVLDARQGKVLKDLIDTLTGSLANKATLVNGFLQLINIPVLTPDKLPTTPATDWFLQDDVSNIWTINEDKLQGFVDARIAAVGGGFVTPTAVNAVINTELRTLTLSHVSYPITEIEYSIDSGATWVQYTGPIALGNLAVNENYYTYRIKAGANRNPGIVTGNPAIPAAGGGGDTSIISGHFHLPLDSGLMGNGYTEIVNASNVWDAQANNNLNVTIPYQLAIGNYVAQTVTEGADGTFGVVDRYQVRTLYGLGLYQETPGGPVYPYYMQGDNVIPWTSGEALAPGDKIVFRYDVIESVITLIPYKCVDNVNLTPMTPPVPIQVSDFGNGRKYIAFSAEKGTKISHPSALGPVLDSNPI